MTQIVNIGEKTIVLDSQRFYTGQENPNDEERLIRKAVGLPITKQLVFYPDKRNADSKVNVLKYQLVEMYDTTDRWYTVEITLPDKSKVRIHSFYLAEMQKPSFIADMAAQEAK